MAVLEIGLLEEPQMAGEIRTPAENTDFEVQFKATPIQICRPDHEEGLIDCHCLRMQKAWLILVNRDPGFNECAIVTSACQADQMGVIPCRNDQSGLDASKCSAAQCGFGCHIRNVVGSSQGQFIARSIKQAWRT